MRTRASLAAFALLASNAAASASLLPAVEVRARYIGAATGYATRTITRVGALFVLYYPIEPGWPGDYALPPSFFPRTVVTRTNSTPTRISFGMADCPNPDA